MRFSEEVTSALKSLADSIRLSPARRDVFFEVAVKALKQEARVQEGLHETLTGCLGQSFRVLCEHEIPGVSGRVDIAVLEDDRLIGAVEIKAPMTNHDGIRHKTIRRQGLPKDVEKLRGAMSNGAAAIEIFALFEVYGLASDGASEPPLGRSIQQYEKDIKNSFGIKWPTRHDYAPLHGRQKVESACESHGLHLVSPWLRVDLSTIGSNISACIDLAVFEMR